MNIIHKKAIFKYETPGWGAKLICLVYLLIALLFFGAFFSYEHWAGGAPAFIKYFFLLLASLFSFAALKPSNRRGWVYFTADETGINFPSSFEKSTSQTFFHVPWQDVGKVQKEVLYSGVNGLSIELKLTSIEIERYFSDVSRTNKLLGFNQKRGDYFVVAYSNNLFQKLSDVVDTLNNMQLES